MKLSVSRAALAEVRESLDHYKDISRVQAERLAFDIEKAYHLLSTYPYAWPKGRHGTRRCLLSRFPYAVIYRVTGDTARVLALAHLKRKPGYWKPRK